MNMHKDPLRVFVITITTIAILLIAHFPHPSHSALDSFVYVGCSQLKYTPGSPYDSAVNSILSSAVNSAFLSTYNNFKAPLPQTNNAAAVYGLFQCRGDLSTSACRDCVSTAVARLGQSCAGSSGAALQLDGCFVRYDNASFVGDQDKSVVSDRCGPAAVDGDSDVLARRDAVLTYLAGGGGGGTQFFRVAGSGRVQGVAQCTQDLSAGECQDCLSEAIQRLKSECGSSPSGDMFLGKCYARYAVRGYTSSSGNDDEVEKTLAIFIGLVAAVALLIVFLTFLSRLFQKNKGGK